MKVLEKIFDKAILFELKKHEDERGSFTEIFSEKKYYDVIGHKFVQDNFSYSRKNVLRGLHFQDPNPQGKLVYATRGKILDVIVDIQYTSKTFGQYYSVELSENNKYQLWIPEGFAHGYCVLSNDASIVYKCTRFYDPTSEKTILWNDHEIGIEWPHEDFIISKKDKNGIKLSDLS